MGIRKKCVVFMSAYNGSKFIGDQIDSIINQEGVEILLIIRDDGSKDNTGIIIKDWQRLYPNNIKIIEGENVGIHRSFAKLMEYDFGDCDYVAFSDQDDVWDSDKLLSAIKQMSDVEADFYSSSSRLVDEHLCYLGSTTSNTKLQNHYMNTRSALLSPGTQGCTIVLSIDFFISLRMKGIPDYYGHDTWITVVAYYLKQCIYDEIPHMSYRQHNQSWTGNRKNKLKQLKREFCFFIKGMERYTSIAQDMIQKYENELSEYDCAVLKLMALPNKPIKDRVKLITMKQFGKYGFLQNIIFKMYLFIGKI